MKKVISFYSERPTRHQNHPPDAGFKSTTLGVTSKLSSSHFIAGLNAKHSLVIVNC